MRKTCVTRGIQQGFTLSLLFSMSMQQNEGTSVPYPSTLHTYADDIMLHMFGRTQSVTAHPSQTGIGRLHASGLHRNPGNKKF
jgi:hypothetical protein